MVDMVEGMAVGMDTMGGNTVVGMVAGTGMVVDNMVVDIVVETPFYSISLLLLLSITCYSQ